MQLPEQDFSILQESESAAGLKRSPKCPYAHEGGLSVHGGQRWV